MQVNSLVNEAKEIGYSTSAELKTSTISFDQSLRDLCMANSCGKSGTNWCCPPACGEYEELREMVLTFENGLLLQKVYKIEDSFDIEGMIAASEDFHTINGKLNKYVREKHSSVRTKLLGAGGCEICDDCTYPDAPCRYPDDALISIEACCINAYELCNSAGISYINGQNTVSYLALLLY